MSRRCPALADDPPPPSYTTQFSQALNKCKDQTQNRVTCVRRAQQANACLNTALNATPAFNLARQYVRGGTPPKDAAWVAAQTAHVPAGLAYAATQMPASMTALEFSNLVMQRCLEDEQK
jgi:hypothetical protein